MTTIEILASAGFGAVFQEVLHWYRLRDKLQLGEYQRLLKSAGYWVLAVLVIVGSTVGTYLFYGEDIESASAFAIMAAGFPLLFKKGVAAAVSEGEHFGAEQEAEGTLDLYVRAA